MTRPLHSSLAAFLAILAVLGSAPDARAESSGRRLGLGLSLDTSSRPAFDPPASGGVEAIPIRLVIDWRSVERDDGSYAWSHVESEVSRWHAAGARVTLALTGPHPGHVRSGALPTPLEEGSVEAWTAFVRLAVRRFGGRIDALGIWEGGDRGPAGRIDPAEYAFLLKSSALAARAEARALGVELRIAQMPVGRTDVAWQRALWDNDAAAYIDVLPVALGPGAGPGEVDDLVAELAAENLRHPPAAELWAVIGAGDADVWQSAADAVRALARGVAVALITPPGVEPEAWATIGGWVAGAHRLLEGGYAPAPAGHVSFVRADGTPIGDAVALGAFVAEQDLSTLIFYRARSAAGDAPRDLLVVDSDLVRNARLLDPLGGEVLRVGAAEPPGGGRGRAIRILGGERPGVVQYERVASSAGFELPPEGVETSRERELTAEEIIARYQAVQKLQDDRLERWVATGRIDYHVRFAQGGSTIDISIDTRYFWERGGDLEWEELNYYINGNLVPWKNFPNIPLVQPEKVITLPLDLTLDRTYGYRLLGREAVEGREAYLLEFRPDESQAERSLYRGRVWIDATGFQRVKAALIQTEMESPVLSNEEIDRYVGLVDPAGAEFWVLDQIDGQQVWNTAGRNFVVRRRVSFTGYELNPAAESFESRRQEAYASRNNMMRDTREGFRYLERQPDGTRLLKEPATSQWAAAVGAFRSGATDGVQPFGGANYFDFDLGGKNVQVNALIGVVVNFVTLSKPDLAGGKLSATGDLFLSGLFFDDKVFLADSELVEQRIDTRAQAFDARLGWQLSKFAKLNLIGGVEYREFEQNEEGQAAREAYDATHPGQSLRFVPPRDHTLGRGEAQLEFSRRGYSLVAQASLNRRSEWESWGLIDEQAGGHVTYDETSGTYVAGEAPAVEPDYAKWSVDGFKEWYLPGFQKLRGQVNLLGGSRLDRFSKYQFGLFGDDRLSGFAGSGVRFEEGAIARVGYAFNLFEAIRFDAVLEQAWIRDAASFDGARGFGGVGFTANFVGPWKTVFTLNYGRAVVSDIPDLEGSDEFFLLILKLF